MHHPRRWKEDTVLRGRLHYHRFTQGSLCQTWRRCYAMLDCRLQQCNGQSAQDLPDARRKGLLLTARMLDPCTQERRKLQKAHQEIEMQFYQFPICTHFSFKLFEDAKCLEGKSNARANSVGVVGKDKCRSCLLSTYNFLNKIYCFIFDRR